MVVEEVEEEEEEEDDDDEEEEDAPRVRVIVLFIFARNEENDGSVVRVGFSEDKDGGDNSAMLPIMTLKASPLTSLPLTTEGYPHISI